MAPIQEMAAGLKVYPWQRKKTRDNEFPLCDKRPGNIHFMHDYVKQTIKRGLLSERSQICKVLFIKKRCRKCINVITNYRERAFPLLAFLFAHPQNRHCCYYYYCFLHPLA